MTYRIKSVAALTGLTTSTLRAWERRYGLLSPGRTAGGYRLYTEDDVARLARVKSLLDNGFKISEAIALIEREAPPLAPADASVESLETIREELQEALLSFDRPAASRVAERMAALTFERRVDEVLLPILRAVGDCWERGDASVAQEHFTSAFIREKLIGMLQELDSGSPTGPEAVCAGVPGEAHEMGLLAAAVHLAVRGWRVTYLGMELPFEDLEFVVRARRPALLCTSLILQREPAEYQQIARRLRALAPAETTVVIGGAGVDRIRRNGSRGGIQFARDIPSLLDSLNVAGAA